MENKIKKEFKPTSWAIDNKTSTYVLTFIIAIFGIISYNSIPKEQFPELVIPTIMVNTIYAGTSPADMENLVTRPIEKNLKSINGVKKITSRSIQDFSMIIVEFNTNVDVAEAKQKVKDAVDKSMNDLPNNLTKEPSVMEIDFSEIPIMNINIAGDFSLDKLKKYAEIAQDRIEALKEITRVDIIGALDREIQIDVDMFKMQSATVTFSDIERAIAYENMTISGGTIDLQGMRRTIRIVGEFKDVETIKNITFRSSGGAPVLLSQIAEIKDDFKEQESFSRINNKNVITLNVIKKSGENLIEASDKIKDILNELKENQFPKNLNVFISGEMARFTRNTLKELNNTIIIGFILVTVILMFFMGFTNAFFVAMSAPLSMALTYIVMPGIDFTMNMLVMFSFIFALGIIVDDAIVVIENTHRIFKKQGESITQSAKWAAGEVFIPILSGTLTTLAPFFPLAFWPGIVGKFMYFIPVTLILTLFASLIVAYIINPVFAVSFMKHDDEENTIPPKTIFKWFGVFIGTAIICYICQWFGLGNFMILISILYLFHNLYGYKILLKFQKHFIPAMMNRYERLLRWSITGKNPIWLMTGLVVLFFITIFITIISKPKVVLFPVNEPNQIITYIKLPVGTSLSVTDSITNIVEKRIYSVIGKNNPDVESVLTNVALGSSENMFDNTTITSNRAKITVNFVEYNYRKGVSTTVYLDSIRQKVKGIPGTEIAVEKNRMGPPTGKPVNIELSGEDIDKLIATTARFKKHIETSNIKGIEELKSDFETSKPEITIELDRTRANREGLSTGQIGSEIRTAIYGKEISKLRDGEEQYPIQLRYNKEIRKNIDKILNHKIVYRDMNTGMLRQIPLSAVAKISYENTYGGINRKNLKRIITLSSDVLTGYTANEVVAKIKKAIKKFDKPDDIEISITGEQESQMESMSFLNTAMLLSLFLVMFILITQFNSITKTMIILSEVIFSIIGVLLGFILFDLTFSIIMTGIGIVALGGIVVRNGILLVEFTDILKSQGISKDEAIVQGGKTRITPVILTASAAILGLIPLGIGMNIDFISMFTHLDPKLHFGGDNSKFFGALAWTIIFGLAFATFLTLIMVPVMYKLFVKDKK